MITPIEKDKEVLELAKLLYDLATDHPFILYPKKWETISEDSRKEWYNAARREIAEKKAKAVG